MNIETYDFGSIKINNRVYSKDVIVFPDHVLNYWTRKESYTLVPSDLVDLLKVESDLILIGTGYSKVIEVTKETEKYLKEKKVKFKIMNSREAVRKYQELSEKRPKEKVILAIHLTC